MNALIMFLRLSCRGHIQRKFQQADEDDSYFNGNDDDDGDDAARGNV